jgi:hypothetical protein
MLPRERLELLHEPQLAVQRLVALHGCGVRRARARTGAGAGCRRRTGGRLAITDGCCSGGGAPGAARHRCCWPNSWGGDRRPGGMEGVCCFLSLSARRRRAAARV